MSSTSTPGSAHTAGHQATMPGQDPSRTWPGQGAEQRQEQRRPQLRVRTFTESKAGYKTTEFWILLAAVAGILIATYADSDSFSRVDGWQYVTWAVVAYLVSRGLAKLGTREPYTDTVE